MHRFTSHLRERRERRQHREETVTARLKGESCIPGHLIPADLVDHLCTFIPRTHLRKICEVGLRSEPLVPVPVPHPAGTEAEGDNKNKVQIRMLLQGSDTCKLMLVAPSTTSSEILPLAEKKFQFPMRLFIPGGDGEPLAELTQQNTTPLREVSQKKLIAVQIKVHIRMSLRGANSCKIITVLPSATSSEVLQLAEKKYQFPVRLFICGEDGAQLAELTHRDAVPLAETSRRKLLAVRVAN